MADAQRHSNQDEQDPEYVVEEYYDEGPDYWKLTKQYTLTYVALFVVLFSYTCIGAAVFRALEGSEELRRHKAERARYLDRSEQLVENLWNLTLEHGADEERWLQLAKIKLYKYDMEMGVYTVPTFRKDFQWSFTGALFFSCTVMSTIGYGNIAPVTTGGRVFLMFYAVFGIAMLLLVLASIGSLFARGATLTYRLLHMNIQMAKGGPPPAAKKKKRLRAVRVPSPTEEGVPLKDRNINGSTAEQRPSIDEVIRDVWSNNEPEIDQSDIPPMRVVTLKEHPGDEARPTRAQRPGDASTADEYEDDDEDENQVDIPLTIVLLFALMYVCMLAGMLSIWENQWNYFEAFYFSFITLTTIGFGDIVPQHQKNLLACTFFILLGMAIMSMCIALAQEIIMKKVAWISERVGVALIKAKPT